MTSVAIFLAIDGARRFIVVPDNDPIPFNDVVFRFNIVATRFFILLVVKLPKILTAFP